MNAFGRRRLRRRMIVTTTIVAFLTALVVAAVVGYQGLTDARAQLNAARESLQDAALALQEADLDGASRALAEVEQEATDATESLNVLPLRASQSLPIVGATTRKAVSVAEAARRIAQTGRQVSDVLLTRQDALSALSLDTTEPGWLDTVAGLRQPLLQAQTALSETQQSLESTAGESLSQAVDEAHATLMAEIEAVQGLTTAAVDLTQLLPDLLGAEESRVYYIGAQNPAELRGTGGIIGAYSLLYAEDGALRFEPFRSVSTLPPDLLDATTAPSAEYLDRYSSFSTGRGTWSNVNASPDFPSVARTIEAYLPGALEMSVDGVIVLDPEALQVMLDVTGPVNTDLGRLEADTVINYVVREAPEIFPSQAERKTEVGVAAGAVLREFLTADLDPIERFRALAEITRDGHLLIHSTDAETQEQLGRIGLTGALPEAAPGFIGVIGYNTNEHHGDFFVRRSQDMEVFLNPDGSAVATVAVTFDNQAPTEGVPSYFIGPNYEEEPRLAAGDNATFTSLYCGTCEISDVQTVDDWGYGWGADSERGHTIASTIEHMESGASQTVVYTIVWPDAWDPDDPSPTFSTEVWHQPAINPTIFTLRVRAPSGRAILEDGRPVESSSWDGRITRTMTFDVALTPPA